MAKMTFKTGDEYAVKLSRLKDKTGEVAKKAIFSGAKVVADKIRNNLSALPEDDFRKLDVKNSEQFQGVPKGQKKDLEQSLGVTPIDRDKNGDWNTKIGFDGYGSAPTKKYPQGVPNQLVARAVESGSSVRRKTPFVRPAVNATKKQAISEMAKTVDEEIAKIMK